MTQGVPSVDRSSTTMTRLTSGSDKAERTAVSTVAEPFHTAMMTSTRAGWSDIALSAHVICLACQAIAHSVACTHGSNRWNRLREIWSMNWDRPANDRPRQD